MDVVVRKATPFDAAALADLKRRSSGALLFRLGHSIEEISAWQVAFCSTGSIKDHTETPGDTLFMLEAGGTPQGMASMSLKESHGVTHCHFGNLYTVESAKGFGSRLMQHRLGAADALGADYSECHVHSLNSRARRFVEHYQFNKRATYREKHHGGEMIIYRRVTP